MGGMGEMRGMRGMREMGGMREMRGMREMGGMRGMRGMREMGGTKRIIPALCPMPYTHFLQRWSFCNCCFKFSTKLFYSLQSL
ncbi:hypothetical protein JYQ62_22560 [Nostoc sp. UHCC 0702]|nr:hypothetical protein JYQ62_22560 [Nostoc sp. UHCC 0702]